MTFKLIQKVGIKDVLDMFDCRNVDAIISAGMSYELDEYINYCFPCGVTEEDLYDFLNSEYLLEDLGVPTNPKDKEYEEAVVWLDNLARRDGRCCNG